MRTNTLVTFHTFCLLITNIYVSITLHRHVGVNICVQKIYKAHVQLIAIGNINEYKILRVQFIYEKRGRHGTFR